MFAKRDTKRLPTYKYNNQDNSFLTNTPVLAYWNYLSPYIPNNWSPNRITVTGFLVMAVNTAAVIYHDPLYEGSNRLMCLLTSISMIFYATMDALDGVQARKHKTGSSFGQLVDHGIDSLVNTFLIICISSGLGISSKKHVLLLLLGTQAIFYWSTVEEYYRKCFFLPFFGPTEAILSSSFFLIIISALGRQNIFFLKRKHSSSLKKFSYFLSILITCSVTVYYIYSIYKKHKFYLSKNILQVFLQLGSHILFILMQLSMYTVAIYHRKLSYKGMLAFLGTCTMCFSLFTTLCIYSNQLHAPCIEFPVLLPLLVYASAISIMCLPSKILDNVYYSIFLIALINYVYNIRGISTEALSALGIPFFNNTPIPPKQA
ncbi:ethanolaminephosphotransferase [Nematocida sp. LUAm3]|nr:ethanolaminephosphotransferase [Nematocida sp. LUAm3]KAI5173528.1 ethanolaminephosphotransferase [Nematocida sp. LUAm2]KAI5176749.1 ethanolaminephosphotransferase [Nematocida sp. LUAm1]